jgi:hypothetical protein
MSEKEEEEYDIFSDLCAADLSIAMSAMAIRLRDAGYKIIGIPLLPPSTPPDKP